MPTGNLGPFIGPSHVRDAVVATLNLWAPAYVQEAVRQTAALNLNPPLANFETWVNEPGISPVSANEAPRWVVNSPGTLGTPRRNGDGTYIADWGIQIGIWTWGPDYQETEDRLGYYLTAMREALLQHPSLGGFAQGTWWRGENYQPAAPPTAFHQWGQGVLLLGCKVRSVMNAFAGWATPPSPVNATPPVPPAITSEHITVNPKTT